MLKRRTLLTDMLIRDMIYLLNLVLITMLIAFLLVVGLHLNVNLQRMEDISSHTALILIRLWEKF